MASSIAFRSTSSAIFFPHSSLGTSCFSFSSSRFAIFRPAACPLKTLTLRFCFPPSPSFPVVRTEDVNNSGSPPPPPPRLVEEGKKENGENGDALKAAVEALDMRVGRILKAWRHPDADSLYVEEVDVGEADPRTICSGLVNYIAQEELQDRNVVVLANLKPRNMRGVKSNGMLMAASDAAHENVELLTPPEGSVPGERIWFGSDEESNSQSDAASPNQVQKKKIWETVQPLLKTTESCVAVLGDRSMRTSAGVVTCRSLKNANIS
uniref:tRNA-binding domain-containing protein n=1 Tax=Araucaria cunninghamii TaxID=56994 RepID=A0A0D6R6T1_ARACU